MTAELRRADLPSVSVTADIVATPEHVWAVVTDIALPVAGSGELRAVEWVAPADSPGPGAVFLGQNSSERMGEWTTTCTVVDYCAPRVFRWAVQEPPLAWWGYELSVIDGGTRVTQTFKLGPGISGLDPLIERFPDREHEFISGRFAQKAAEMSANLVAVGAALGADVTPVE